MTLVEDFFEMRNSSVQYMLIDEDTNNCTIIDLVLDLDAGEADGATGQASRAMAVIAQELIWINAPTSDLEQNTHPCGNRYQLRPTCERDLQLAVIDRAGEHALVFACRRTGKDAWIDALTGRLVEVHPTHWREWIATRTRGPLH